MNIFGYPKLFIMLMKKCLLSFICFYTLTANAQLNVSPAVSANVLISSFVGQGITVSNVVITGSGNAYGTFSNGNTTNLGIEKGAVLTTGSAIGVKGPNNSGSYGTCNGLSGNDAQLASISPYATEDMMILEFDFVPQTNKISLGFVFGSEEYPEFVNASYNDAFGFFLTGPGPACQAGFYSHTNIATLPNNVTPVSIDNVNTTTNSSYYVNNLGGATIQYDGFTKKIVREVNVCASQSYHLKIVIADAGDCYYDSGVFIEHLTSGAAVLPIRMSDFSATTEPQAVKLQWKTLSERENKEFVIMRSGTDGKIERIGSLPGAGNSNTEKSYLFYDRAPLNGINYYQLLQVDENGNQTEVGIKKTNFNLQIAKVQLYPNPTSTEVSVTFEKGVYRKLILTDLLGRELEVIAIKPDSYKEVLSLRKYPEAIYLIRLDGPSQTRVEKIVKK